MLLKSICSLLWRPATLREAWLWTLKICIIFTKRFVSQVFLSWTETDHVSKVALCKSKRCFHAPCQFLGLILMTRSKSWKEASESTTKLLKGNYCTSCKVYIWNELYCILAAYEWAHLAKRTPATPYNWTDNSGKTEFPTNEDRIKYSSSAEWSVATKGRIIAGIEGQ